MTSIIYFEQDGNLNILKSKSVGILGYGNVAKAYALNLRDSDIHVTIGVNSDLYRQRAKEDNFEVKSIPEVTTQSQILFFLLPEENFPSVYQSIILPNLPVHSTLVFSNGYPIIFDKLKVPDDSDVLLLSPRIPGVAIREKYLTKESFFCLVGIHQDSSGQAEKILLALTLGLGGLKKPAVKISFAHQIVMQLFVEQTFSYAMAQILILSAMNLMDHGYPPEAILVELVLSGEGGYTIDKGIEVGMIKQMNFHSQTSQYGQMSRTIKFRSVAKDVEQIQQQILRDILSGEFSSEWYSTRSKVLLHVMKYYNEHTKFAEVERQVRDKLGFKSLQEFPEPILPSEQIIQGLNLSDLVERIKLFYKEA